MGRGIGSGKAKTQALRESIRELVIEPDFDQLDSADRTELYRQQQDVTSNVQILFGHAVALKSANIIGKQGKNAAKMLEALKAIQNLAGDTIKKMNAAPTVV